MPKITRETLFISKETVNIVRTGQIRISIHKSRRQ
jgi:hypothetical protein